MEFQGVVGDITEYLKALDQVVTIENLSPLNLGRISQLSQKTNQFNTTTRRYLEGDIKKMADSGRFLIVGIRVQDKFGDSGLTGVAIVEKKPEAWRIDSFLLSCRVIGRKVEDALLAYIKDQARTAGAKGLTGEFIPTKKNAPAKDFYRTREFNKTSEADGVEIWEYGLRDGVHFSNDTGTLGETVAALDRGGFAHGVVVNLFSADLFRQQYSSALPPEAEAAERDSQENG